MLSYFFLPRQARQRKSKFMSFSEKIKVSQSIGDQKANFGPKSKILADFVRSATQNDSTKKNKSTSSNAESPSFSNRSLIILLLTNSPKCAILTPDLKGYATVSVVLAALRFPTAKGRINA